MSKRKQARDKRAGAQECANSIEEVPKPEYEVGYGRPPKHTRIQKGQVLNQNGRPKGSKNKPSVSQDFYNVIMEEARREVPLGDAMGTSVTMMRAVVRSTLVHAAKGSTRAQQLSADMMRLADLETKRHQEKEITTALDYKRLCGEEMTRRKRRGDKDFDFLPNPDHVEIDLANSCVQIRGPVTETERVGFKRWGQYRSQLLEEIKELQQALTSSPKSRHHDLREEMDDTRLIIDIIGLVFEGNRHALEFLEGPLRAVKRQDPEFYFFD